MSFKITIEETREIITTTGKDWAEVDTEEVEREGVRGIEPEGPKTRVKPVYGYTPEVEKRVTVTREVFMQNVDELDLGEVIKAVNFIS